MSRSVDEDGSSSVLLDEEGQLTCFVGFEAFTWFKDSGGKP
jgi:hypothetical protein